MQKLIVQVWSDIACPWCYVGKRRLEGALARFAHQDEVAVLWRSFELDPSAPRVPTSTAPYAERLARKYGFSVAKAEQRLASMTELAAREGLDFRFDRVQPGNTFDAHRLLHLAAERGVQGALKERLLRAYFTEGLAITDRDVLARLAGECGLDVDEATAVLAGDAHARDVRSDEETAHASGVTGVPFFLVGRFGVSGAQPAELLLQALTKAWAAREPEPTAPGVVCGPDGCV